MPEKKLNVSYSFGIVNLIVKCRGDNFCACGLHRQVSKSNAERRFLCMWVARQGRKYVADMFCASGLHRQGSMCVALSTCVLYRQISKCVAYHIKIGISIVVIFLVSYICHICGIF